MKKKKRPEKWTKALSAVGSVITGKSVNIKRVALG